MVSLVMAECACASLILTAFTDVPSSVRVDPTYFSLTLTLTQYLIAFCSRPEATYDLMPSGFEEPVDPDDRVKFGDPRLNFSQESPPAAVWGGIFDGFFAVTSDRK